MKNTGTRDGKDKKLLCAFGVLIFLTILIGVTGILQIRGLARQLDYVGKRNLNLQRAVLEMRIDDTVYAAGIRNYAFWKVSRYLDAAQVAANLNRFLSASRSFKEQLRVFEANAYLPQQAEWARQIGLSFTDLTVLGQQILDLINSGDTAAIEKSLNNLLMVFEGRLYKIDDFLDNTISKANVGEVESQIARADAAAQASILFLALILTAEVTVGVLIAFSVYRQRKKERLYREGLFSQMINLEENERKSLSTAVHDQMGQDLSALKIYLGLIEQGLAAPAPDMRDKIAQTRKIVSGLIDKSHNISFLLRPPDLDDVGLVSSIEALLIEYKHLTGVAYRYDLPFGPIVLPPAHSLLIYRIAQELLTNMAKHSRAKTIELRLSREENRIDFFYSDDGIGFDYGQVLRPLRRRIQDKFKLGLQGLKERVELLDGSMRIDSAPGKGTRIAVTLNI
jgi:signal transduction histidine kinase